MPHALGRAFGEPSLPQEVAQSPVWAPQPGARPVGAYTGVPPATRFSQERVIPATSVGVGGAQASCIVMASRESRIVVLTAPDVAFAIHIGGDAGVSLTNGIPLPAGQPYEVLLPGNQAIWAVTDAPVYLRVRVHVSVALAGDVERRL